MQHEPRDVAPGPWLWWVEYPDWRPRPDWGPVVASICVESVDEVALLDPLAPPDDAGEIWERLVLKPDALTAPEGELRVWSTPWHQERALPAHGKPVHDRAAYERALELPPWAGWRRYFPTSASWRRSSPSPNAAHSGR
jgi:hypothetical protein